MRHCLTSQIPFVWLSILIAISIPAFPATNINPGDTIKPILPKHYFQTMLVINGYRKPTRNLADTANAISKRLQTYGIKQSCITLQIPLVTKDFPAYSSDTNAIANTHLLLTGTFVNLRPQFDGIKEHRLTKRGIGLRYIYNNGKKGVWFFDISPFVTRDASFKSTPYFRLASTAIYSHNVTEKFNVRLGITKSFLWGNRYYLPFIGIRVGKLDKLNLSIQFPRSVTLFVPLGAKAVFSLYTKPQGGMYNFSNQDSLYSNKAYSTFHFTRYEINTGFRFDFRIGDHFSLFVSTGLSTKNNITFYSDKANSARSKLPYRVYFYSKNPAPTLFFDLGMVFKFGKSRSIYNNRNLYDAVDLNSTNSQNNGNREIPLTPKKMPSRINLESIQDLVDYNDF